MKIQLLYLVVITTALLGCLVSGQPTVVPQPQSYQSGSVSVLLNDKQFSIEPSINSATFNVAVKRYSSMFFQFGDTTPYFEKGTGASGLNTLNITIESTSEDLYMGVDESYSITATSSELSISAKTIYGAMRGLETFSQLIIYDQSSKTYSIPNTPIAINDYPRFPWRGFMIDTARHWYPPSFILHIIDTLGYNKFNVLHWHLSDAQSFPVESKIYPNLTLGAFNPLAVFSHEQIEEIVAYAKTYGIRVIPEFDLPGHAAGWGIGYPDLLAQCPGYAYNINNIALDIASEGTYDFLRNFFTEMTQLFPDAYFHTGGDEVVFGCWTADPAIQSWMNKMGFSTSVAFEYFENQMDDILIPLNRTKITWNDPFEAGVKLGPDTLIQIWNSATITQQVLEAGYKALVSFAWYLDQQVPMGNTYYEFEDTWKTFYSNDPLNGITTNAQNLLGGEAAMWSEQVSQMSWDVRVWPRSLAIAERLWSAESVTDITSAIPRFDKQSCSMAIRGVNSGPLQSDFCLLPIYLYPTGIDGKTQLKEEFIQYNTLMSVDNNINSSSFIATLNNNNNNVDDNSISSSNSLVLPNQLGKRSRDDDDDDDYADIFNDLDSFQLETDNVNVPQISNTTASLALTAADNKKKKKRKRYKKKKKDNNISNLNNQNQNNSIGSSNNNNSNNSEEIHTKHLLYSSSTKNKYWRCNDKKDVRVLMNRMFNSKVGQCLFSPEGFKRPSNINELNMKKEIMVQFPLVQRMLFKLKSTPYSLILDNLIREKRQYDVFKYNRNRQNNNITSDEEEEEEDDDDDEIAVSDNEMDSNNNNNNSGFNVTTCNVGGYSQLNLEDLIKGKDIEVHYIYRFILTIINNILPPKQIWRSPSNSTATTNITTVTTTTTTTATTTNVVSNKKQFEKELLNYLKSKTYHYINFDQLVNRFNVNEFIIPKIKYLRSFLWWMFDDMIPTLVTKHFYCTETAQSRISHVYFLMNEWNSLSSTQLKSLKKSNYKLLLNNELASYIESRRTGLSHLRFLPKEKSLRPIANLGKSATKATIITNNGTTLTHRNFKLSSNSTMVDYFPILKYEMNKNQKLLGSTVTSRTDFYHKFKEIKPKLLSLAMRGVKIHIMSIDINKCFDSLMQSKLIQILDENVFVNDKYIISNVRIQFKVKNRRRIITLAYAENDRADFDAMLVRIRSQLNVASVVENKKDMREIGRQEVLEVFDELICEHILKYGEDYYLQTKGIAQGAKSSTKLCELELGDLDNQLLMPRLLDNNPNAFNALVRFVDDYIYFTDSPSNTERFIDVFTNETPALYGVKSNNQKTKQFLHDFGKAKGIVELDGKYMPWCGLLINVESFEILYDYSKYSGKKLINELTFPAMGRLTLQQRLLNFLNSQVKAKLGYQYLAMAFCCWIKKYYSTIALLDFEKVKIFKGSFIKRKVSDIPLKFNDFKWIVYTAFHLIMSKKTGFPIINMLRNKLSILLRSITSFKIISTNLKFLLNPNLSLDLAMIKY
ncbi:beta-N-acetylhexosaminidase [Heterostelium album PN500]|uniref:beta-N-acetylhexosaminidase n=1 Tax=Heterostelium pallidum (strain ATCC 26659 / Pp 5 / PN500) TaxID=670386 RepID=D3BH48_HETP5|nr:beta-N-acetylhexosaminidase [Heterostelium album PN500]EFA79432.1 beta-N-acetylhexosaminidase [Heterostelium album PN500]|eukprot:XP_020431553.1 beta-N-acetylhexosaminidase [Heterostelium album PN500]